MHPTGKFKTPKTHISSDTQAGLTKFPTRREFGKSIKKHFNSGSGKVKVQHWACAKQKHQKGGEHCHVVLKLTDSKRWKSVKESISSKEGIVVIFSDNHNNYYSAYRYTCRLSVSQKVFNTSTFWLILSKNFLDLDMGFAYEKTTTYKIVSLRKSIFSMRIFSSLKSLIINISQTLPHYNKHCHNK